MLAVMNRLRQPDCQTLLVAAAGNDGTGDHRFYPAGFAADDPFASEDLVVAVGALRQDRTARACFSNWGDWVTLYEDGERLVNAFPPGKFVYREPLSRQSPPKCVYHPSPPWADGCTCVTAAVEGTTVYFHGMATWSGTSFATPIVVGRVARHMTEHSQFAHKPRAAMKDLLKQLSVIVDASDSLDLRIFPQPVG
jgi:subtilisin family serine protease